MDNQEEYDVEFYEKKAEKFLAKNLLIPYLINSVLKFTATSDFLFIMAETYDCLIQKNWKMESLN